MSYTKNYNLYITDDSTTKFFDWRTKMNGTDGSNMVKIDDALDAINKRIDDVIGDIEEALKGI